MNCLLGEAGVLAAQTWGRRAGTNRWTTSSRISSVAKGEISANSPEEQALMWCLVYRQPLLSERQGHRAWTLGDFQLVLGFSMNHISGGFYSPQNIICCNRWMVIWQARIRAHFLEIDTGGWPLGKKKKNQACGNGWGFLTFALTFQICFYCF